MKNRLLTILLILIGFQYSFGQFSAGNDTMYCGNTGQLNGHTTNGGYWTVVSGAYANFTNSTNPQTLISGNLGDSIAAVWHENSSSTDTISVEFLIRPTANAGDNEYHICGNCIQLDAHLSTTINTEGRWHIEAMGYFGNACGQNDPAAVEDPNAWFYHSTHWDPGVDTINLKWIEYNTKSGQCSSMDSTMLRFWYKDTAYIKLNNVITDMDSTIGRAYVNIKANENMPSNFYSRGTWLNIDGYALDWWKNGYNNAVNTSNLDSIKVVSINQQLYVWREIAWIIENGDIYGSAPAVCVDTSNIVRIRFDNPVIGTLSSDEIDYCVSISYDTVYISAYSFFGDSIAVEWTFQNASNSTQEIINAHYLFEYNTSGVYSFNLSLNCNNKAITSVLTFTAKKYIIFSNTSISETDSSEALLFPNPSYSYINIVNKSLITEVSVLSADGKVLKTNSGLSTHSSTINLEDLPEGFYLIKILSESSNKTYKILKK